MQNRWYSDNRDIVKWATLLHLAHASDAEGIIHVAFLQSGPDWRKAKLRSGSHQFPIAPEVWEQFPRDVTRICDLAVSVGVPIRVLSGQFRDVHRAKYVAQVTRQIRESGAGRKIVFLDPDNGIAPQHTDGRHVTAEEVAQIWNTLVPADWLVLYQHRQRRARWLERTRAQFAAACDLAASRVQAFTCREIAHDVAFFAARKPRRGVRRTVQQS